MAAPSLRFRHVKQAEIYARRVDYPRLAAGFAASRPDTRRVRRSCEDLTNEVRSDRVPVNENRQSINSVRDVDLNRSVFVL